MERHPFLIVLGVRCRKRQTQSNWAVFLHFVTLCYSTKGWLHACFAQSFFFTQFFRKYKKVKKLLAVLARQSRKFLGKQNCFCCQFCLPALFNFCPFLFACPFQLLPFLVCLPFSTFALSCLPALFDFYPFLFACPFRLLPFLVCCALRNSNKEKR